MKKSIRLILKRDRKKFADLRALADRLIAEEAAIVNAITEAADKTKP
jgi:hypothetical protein